MPLSFLTPDVISAIQVIGFPAVMALLLLGIFFYSIRRSDKRAEKCDSRYDDLVKKMFDSIDKVSIKHEAAAKEVSDKLTSLQTNITVLSLKVDENTKTIDKELEVRNKFLVFKNGVENSKNK